MQHMMKKHKMPKHKMPGSQMSDAGGKKKGKKKGSELFLSSHKIVLTPFSSRFWGQTSSFSKFGRFQCQTRQLAWLDWYWRKHRWDVRMSECFREHDIRTESQRCHDSLPSPIVQSYRSCSS